MVKLEVLLEDTQVLFMEMMVEIIQLHESVILLVEQVEVVQVKQHQTQILEVHLMMDNQMVVMEFKMILLEPIFTGVVVEVVLRIPMVMLVMEALEEVEVVLHRLQD